MPLLCALRTRSDCVRYGGIIGSWFKWLVTFLHRNGTNPYLQVDVVSLNSGLPTGCTWNGTAMTAVAPQTNNDTSAMATYYLTGVSGTQTIVCTATTAGKNMIFIATSYTGVDQTSPIDSASSTSAVGPANTARTYCTTVVNANAWLAANIYSSGSAPSAGTGALLRQIGSNVTIAAFDSNAAVGTGSQCMTINNSGGGGGGLAMQMVSIKPATAAATPTSILGLIRAFWW